MTPCDTPKQKKNSEENMYYKIINAKYITNMILIRKFCVQLMLNVHEKKNNTNLIFTNQKAFC